MGRALRELAAWWSHPSQVLRPLALSCPRKVCLRRVALRLRVAWPPVAGRPLAACLPVGDTESLGEYLLEGLGQHYQLFAPSAWGELVPVDPHWASAASGAELGAEASSERLGDSAGWSHGADANASRALGARVGLRVGGPAGAAVGVTVGASVGLSAPSLSARVSTALPPTNPRDV